MRSMWKGTIPFGLVSSPVAMFAATESHDQRFRQVRRSDGSRIRYRRVAEVDEEEVPYPEIAKGYEMPDGSMLILTEDDLAEIPLPSKSSVEVTEFVPLEQIDPIRLNRSYYLAPDGQAGL